jgi:SAM-dependent methyltransferase
LPDAAEVLSVGCGLGYIEHKLLQMADKRIVLHVHEVTSVALRWLGKEVPAGRRHIGMIPECLPEELRFDLVYLSGVDYAINDREMDKLISAISRTLKPHGRLLLVSGSFLPPESTLRRALVFGKRVVTAVLDKAGFHSRGQFWGWQRNRSEYRGLLERGGFGNIEDGFANTDRQTDYWIIGTKRRETFGQLLERAPG